MKVLVAPDKFKGVLSAQAVSTAMEQGVKRAGEYPVTCCPLADGGDGTMALMTEAYGGQYHTAKVHDPLMQTIEAHYATLGDGHTAYVEMAQASGMTALTADTLNCTITTSYGTGELIEAALNKGAKALMLGLGGSATNDGGAGMAAALGARFYTAEGHLIEQPAGKDLVSLAAVELASMDQRLASLPITVLCDVQNPLLGAEGASRVFGPQKGADPAAIEKLEAGLQQLHAVVSPEQKPYEARAGDGAAGGMGYGARAFLGGRLTPGIDRVMAATGFYEYLPEHDLVLTGEGKLDGTTAKGKVVAGVGRAAQGHLVPVAALCGQVEADPLTLSQMGITYSQSVLKGPADVEEAKAHTAANLERAATSLVLLGRAFTDP